MRLVAVKTLASYAIMNYEPVYTENREQSFFDFVKYRIEKTPTDTHYF
jgi:hypothetical protein